ncbi:hypothetical protein [Frigoriglobus tundricola]|uniref:Uncharacterized protein n=1 Tax=Frigoriglobus tundricola TaxID=2774151 RepID=A0A6M5YN44_9BACT|nr:hypothetical protein [Frigoriglobus tundricola]QJW94723.1 hypothetical protein FTUN_2245 [Frigoriglobus tundricola]
MVELTAKAAAWLQTVLRRLPAAIRAVYVEYTEACAASMEHLVCFNAFGFESLAGGHFDPANAAHVGTLGEFIWEPPDECRFRADDHPGTDWLAVLRAAAEAHEVMGLAAGRGIQIVVGEHDGAVWVIR